MFTHRSVQRMPAVHALLVAQIDAELECVKDKLTKEKATLKQYKEKFGMDAFLEKMEILQESMVLLQREKLNLLNERNVLTGFLNRSGMCFICLFACRLIGCAYGRSKSVLCGLALTWCVRALCCLQM